MLFRSDGTVGGFDEVGTLGIEVGDLEDVLRVEYWSCFMPDLGTGVQQGVLDEKCLLGEVEWLVSEDSVTVDLVFDWFW